MTSRRLPLGKLPVLEELGPCAGVVGGVGGNLSGDGKYRFLERSLKNIFIIYVASDIISV